MTEGLAYVETTDIGEYRIEHRGDLWICEFHLFYGKPVQDGVGENHENPVCSVFHLAGVESLVEAKECIDNIRGMFDKVARAAVRRRAYETLHATIGYE